MSVIVWLVGEEFDPDRAFGSYTSSGLRRLPLTELDQALAAARAILGERIHDIAYRKSRRYLQQIDPSWSPLTGPLPATQPPARWWRVESARERPLAADPPVYLAYEDRHGLWWAYDPRSRKVYQSPWLSDECYDGDCYEGGYEVRRMTKISVGQARELIARGLEDFRGFPARVDGPGLDVDGLL